MKIQCQTLFDITATGVTGHIKPSRMPYVDQAGSRITDTESWNRSRNQQRNWETLTQLIQLRTQLSELTTPVKDQDRWIFEFATDIEGLFELDQDPLGILKSDCAGVPMLTKLGEIDTAGNVLVVEKNIWFSLAPINTL
jgi:hypothetical protein